VEPVSKVKDSSAEGIGIGALDYTWCEYDVVGISEVERTCSCCRDCFNDDNERGWSERLWKDNNRSQDLGEREIRKCISIVEVSSEPLEFVVLLGMLGIGLVITFDELEIEEKELLDTTVPGPSFILVPSLLVVGFTPVPVPRFIGELVVIGAPFEDVESPPLSVTEVIP
jgi:hypothetical protein